MMRFMLISGLILAISCAKFLPPAIDVRPPDGPGASLIDEHSESLHPRNSNEPEAYLVAHTNSNDANRAYMYVDVVVDEEFIEYSGDAWRNSAYHVVEGANELISEVGFDLKVRSLRRWHSDDAVKFISSQIQHLGQQVERPPDQITLAIMGQATTRNDGYVRLQDGVIIVQYNARRPRRIHSLIAHEIGHVIGVNHHDDDEECTEDGCLMDAEGHEYSEKWCNHHKEEIEEKVAAVLTTE